MRALLVLPFILAVSGHGGHGESEGNPKLAGGEYAQKHMATEHHIDSFDLGSFFQLHDLDRNGIWDREEIEAIYGVHHVYSQKKSKDEAEHQQKADHIVDTILKLIDKNRDGKISPEEFNVAGLKGLPNFEDLGAEGHHYDVESEFFLHHEEQFHSTEETQTDDSYHHAEDLEHFAQHESIELREVEKEAKFQGISVEEALRAHDPAPPPNQGRQPTLPKVDNAEGEQTKEEPPVDAATPVADVPKPKITRGTPPEKLDPNVRYKDIDKEGETQADWGTGDDGYKQPKSPVEKMRKNLPYKERMQYKFRRSWGDF
ncbi:hypothetical protein SERLADRAFT_455850 [Serpula lacrymans var. lacrymans S7.9]|uniref:EF-hand domain-containing protein n=1 Tax=Serpula lacrymans var. lacrymans (strain S7.9) TaxID=578457 RepID=F8NEZ3_SERL9|nr:uncharacterized protein SERLADRAFT_455850 [Serpula lacrymans var. lacrymans S7.9]EGO31141.1 hypothetical protein SERLADRAFT_455850 [Serpula lacrymans var. lacrymans S7.9]